MGRLSGIVERFEVGFSILATCEGQVAVDQPGGALAALQAQRAVIVQQDLPLGHAPDIGRRTDACGDQGGVDVAPACWLATALAVAIR